MEFCCHPRASSPGVQGGRLCCRTPPCMDSGLAGFPAHPEPHSFPKQVHVSDPRGELQSHLVNTASLAAIPPNLPPSLPLSLSGSFSKHDSVTLNSRIILHLNRCSLTCFAGAEIFPSSPPNPPTPSEQLSAQDALCLLLVSSCPTVERCWSN